MDHCKQSPFLVRRVSIELVGSIFALAFGMSRRASSRARHYSEVGRNKKEEHPSGCATKWWIWGHMRLLLQGQDARDEEGHMVL